MMTEAESRCQVFDRTLNFFFFFFFKQRPRPPRTVNRREFAYQRLIE